MHLIRNKPAKPEPFIPVRSIWEIPEYRRPRGKRYDANGKLVCVTGARNRIDSSEQKKLIAAEKAARRLKKPVDTTEGFDMERFSPLPGRILCRRPPQIAHERGIQLPEKHWRSEPFFIVVKVGPGVRSEERRV